MAVFLQVRMRDGRVITLIYWEEPLVSAMQQCILPTAINNHAGKYLLGTRVKPWLQQAKPNVANR